MENRKWVAKTFFGFEDITAAELRALGAQDIKIGSRAVEFAGDKGFMYKANLAVRTALRILMPIGHFKAIDDRQLYASIGNINWTDYLKPDQTFWIDATLHSPYFTHSQFVAQRVKDAIVDQFRARTGQRPNIDKDFPTIRIDVRIDRENCTISLDSSGASLHQRGYRSRTNIAPINEVLAAGLLLRSGWDGRSDFLDPMCGSGTLLIEAAMIACNIPANINRKEFAFEKWADWEPELFETIIDSLMHKTREFHYSIVGYDKAPSAVEKARENVANAQLDDYIDIKQASFFDQTKEIDGPLHIVFNPPYGERLDVDTEAFYKRIGDTLKQQYPNTQAWFITAQLEALKHVGLKPSHKHTVFNGSLEARFVHYELYAGSKKAKYQSPPNEAEPTA
jgi:putative N6-adenine-specific DNA methylase